MGVREGGNENKAQLKLELGLSLVILKVGYLSNHLLDHAQILNLSLDDQIIVA